ncbi:MAG: phosphodiesterase YaeI [Planctomycetota bacterium]|jgi:predicted MPP superfamily phosphohydrolase
MKITRRTFLKSIAGLTVASITGISWMKYFEPDWYEITEKNISTGKLKEAIKVLHLSDIHASPSVSLNSIEKAVDLSLEQGADIAFLTGDFITWELIHESEYSRILKKISDQMPVFACVGNHDGGTWAALHGYEDFSKVAALLEKSGVTLLFNEDAVTTVKNQKLRIAGLGDLWSGECRPENVLKKKRETEEFIFVLSHNPDCKTEVIKYDWDIMCCGHTHGGQLVIPFTNFRPFIPVRDRSFPEGLLSIQSKHIHITRGVGNLHGLRFNCRPEISILNVT